MKIELSEFSTGKEIYSHPYHHNFESESDLELFETNVDAENYQINIQENWFEGIHVSRVKIHAKSKVDFLYRSSIGNIGFLYCLQGELAYFDENKTNNLVQLKARQQYISLGSLDHVVLEVTSSVEFIYIQLTKSYFNRIADIAFHPDQFINKKNISPEIELMLHALIHSKYTGRVKRLFIESKIFELIIFYINQKNRKIAFSVKKDDIDKILQAKSLIESNIQKPYSLVELSRKVGINDFKLKKGFKEIIGCTVFGYLYKIRMQQAHYYLSKEKKAVSEVSFLVGYKNPQHFIAAFKKIYHVLPGSLNKL